ncbi:lipid A deacylase LpxR family protein [Cellvibrio sp. pealriver]|uniref:lipid A deacylase LpxR family protein n=1 Tax=Cellvibrio sp. pealriver TaxID=1622269 RepID=UPI000A651485|nr:lipid A deacylase LpxR family protein [Cellvibrio sp. pealriver]
MTQPQIMQLPKKKMLPSIDAVQAIYKLVLALIIGLLLSNNTSAKTKDYLAQQDPEWLQLAASIENEKQPNVYWHEHRRTATRSWAIAFDNDILVPGHRDQDYTYGLNFTQTGESVRHAAISLNKPLLLIDNWLGFQHGSISTQETYSREIGLFGFTPEDITLEKPNSDDRPYASLIYLSSSREQVDLVENLAWKSTLTLGFLGTGLVGELQNVAHQGTAGKEAKGWDNQISEGGELTGRYLIARQQYFDNDSDTLEIKSTWQASIGYLTETSWSLSMRAGQIHSPWSSFNPELASYGEKSSYSSNAKSVSERYFWAGVALKARAYNAFLQGQFRDSLVSYEHHELRPVLIEAWLGYTFAFKQGYRISYVLRGHSSEIERGAGDRNLLWGGIIIARNI